MLGGASVAWPRSGTTKAAEPLRKIGLLSASAKDDADDRSRIAAFRQKLAELGWVEGGNLSLEQRNFFGDAAQEEVEATELVGLEPDVIVAVGTSALRRLAAKTRTIPIVFSQVLDPVALGFVASLARPGGNITGFTSFTVEIGSKWLETLKRMVPALTRAIVLYGAEYPNTPIASSIEVAAKSLGVTTSRAPLRREADIENAIAAVGREPVGGLVVINDGFTIPYRSNIVAAANRHNLPAIYPYRSFVDAGGLVSYGFDLTQEYQQTAPYVDRILRGANPGDLPVQQPSRYQLVINLKAAKALGLAVPPMLLALADEVIE